MPASKKSSGSIPFSTKLNKPVSTVFVSITLSISLFLASAVIINSTGISPAMNTTRVLGDEDQFQDDSHRSELEEKGEAASPQPTDEKRNDEEELQMELKKQQIEAQKNQEKAQEEARKEALKREKDNHEQVKSTPKPTLSPTPQTSPEPKTSVDEEDENLQGYKVKYEVHNGRVEAKMEALNTLTETGLEDELEVLTTAIPFAQDFEIKAENNRLKLKHGSIEAYSRFPVSVNPETKELTVSTPNGERVVSILPEQVIEALKQNGIPFSALAASLEIEAESDKVRYQAIIQKQEKLLGLFPLTFTDTVHISVDSGDVEIAPVSLTNRMMRWVSF